MRRYLFACVPLLLLSVQPPVYAKEREVRFGGPEMQAQEEEERRHVRRHRRRHRRHRRSAAGALRPPIGVLALPVGSLLTDAIIRKLDCKEQVQAATATDTAVRGGVGTTSTWESETRPGVKGSSTVVAIRGLPPTAAAAC